MGEEEEKKEEVKEEEKKEEEIVLKVDMHCEGCARKVAKSLKKCEGVEEVKTDSKLRKVVVKGKEVDPIKLCERIQKKTGRKTEIISPLPKPPEEEKKDAAPPPPEEKNEEPKAITVVLKVRMHCESCAQVLQKRIKKMDGVESVVTDVANDQITVTGFLDPEKLAEDVSRRTKRQAFIVKNEEKKEEEKKEEKSEGEKKEEEEKSEGEKKEEEEEDKKSDEKKVDYYSSPRYYTDQYAYTYPPQAFSDENPNACSIM